MKFYSNDPAYFSEVSEDLKTESTSVSVGHLSYLNAHPEFLNKQWIAVCEGLEPKELISEFFNRGHSHLVQKDDRQYLQALRRAAGLIENPKAYFDHQYSFVGNSGVTQAHFKFSSAMVKADLFAAMTAFTEQIESAPAREAATAVLEELYMNATIDAPKESKRLGLTANSQDCELFLSFNQDTLQISCTDPFGSLDMRKLFGRMHEVYEKGAGQAINLNSASGAGIGCFLLLEKCRALVFGVQKGIRTKVTCLIPLSKSFRESSRIKKCLHGFEVE